MKPTALSENNPLRLVDRDGRVPEDVQQAFRAAFGKPSGGFDYARLSAFNSQLLRSLKRSGPKSVRLGAVLGRIAAEPGKAARAGGDSFIKRFGAKPLVEVNLKKTKNGFQLKALKVSPFLGFKQFTIKKKPKK